MAETTTVKVQSTTRARFSMSGPLGVIAPIKPSSPALAAMQRNECRRAAAAEARAIRDASDDGPDPWDATQVAPAPLYHALREPLRDWLRSPHGVAVSRSDDRIGELTPCSTSFPLPRLFPLIT